MSAVPDSTILVVDDDETFCSALARALGRRGFTAYEAHDIDNAMRLALGHRPAFAVVDLRVGEESGLELVDRLKRADNEIRIVVLTGYASIATAVEAIKLGAVHYLTKPAQADDIVNALQSEEGKPDAPVAERPMSVQRVEWEHIQSVLARHDGNVSAAARALGMHRRSLQRKLQKRPVRA